MDSVGRSRSTETWRCLDPAHPMPLVVCEKDAAGGLIARRLYGCALVQAPLRVVAAMLTPSGRDLLVATSVVLPPDHGAGLAWRLISVHVSCRNSTPQRTHTKHASICCHLQPSVCIHVHLSHCCLHTPTLRSSHWGSSDSSTSVQQQHAIVW